MALQILGLLIGGLVVAQFVTLLLTMLLPPPPPQQYALEDIAAALRGEDAAAAARLQRRVQGGPPDLAGPGWLVSERSRTDLARLIGVSAAEVSLAFYTPLPFAGTAAPPPPPPDDGPYRPLSALSNGGERLQAGLILAQVTLPPGGRMPPYRPAPRPAAPEFMPRPRGALPPGMLPGGPPRVDRMARQQQGAPPLAQDGGIRPQRGGLYDVGPTPPAGERRYIPGDGTAAVPRMPRGAPPSFDPARDAGGPSGGGVRPPPIDLVGQLRSLTMLQWNPSATARPGEPEAPPVAPDQPAAPPNPPAGAAPVRDVPAPRVEATPPEPARSRPEALPVPAPIQMPVPALTQPPPVAIDAPERGLFGVAAAPFVQGDFVAALRLDEDRWAIVQPAAEAFPNVWQRRLILWFAIAFAIVAPVGWLFARRLSKPLGQFAVVAERLGRDPAASVVAVGGPAELGRATHAFNLMQTRLRAFVADRTAMIGAISHDLRTPLTRMRFRIEDVPDELREGLLEEVEEMEGMITSVLEFIRDASSPGLRERIDLRTLVEDVVEDAVLVGNDVAVAEVRPAIVDVDVLGMRRVLNNLLENAIKYGGRARVRLVTDDGCAIAEIIDAGPGLPEYEIERVFEPFYRSESARSSDKSGHGLGLAVCRSIARAHGGDVRFIRSSDGFRAQLRLPLAYSTS